MGYISRNRSLSRETEQKHRPSAAQPMLHRRLNGVGTNSSSPWPIPRPSSTIPTSHHARNRSLFAPPPLRIHPNITAGKQEQNPTKGGASQHSLQSRSRTLGGRRAFMSVWAGPERSPCGADAITREFGFEKVGMGQLHPNKFSISEPLCRPCAPGSAPQIPVLLFFLGTALHCSPPREKLLKEIQARREMAEAVAVAVAVAYEAQRQRQVEANKRKLDELQLHRLSAAVREAAAAAKPSPVCPGFILD